MKTLKSDLGPDRDSLDDSRHALGSRMVYSVRAFDDRDAIVVDVVAGAEVSTTNVA